MSEQFDDGGAAFPHGPLGMSYTGEDGYTSHQCPAGEGMSLRDYLAAAALNGMLANSHLCKMIHEMKSEAISNGIDVHEFEAKFEYPAQANAACKFADALIAELRKPSS